VINAKEKLIHVWLEGIISSEDLEKEISYYLEMIKA